MLLHSSPFLQSQVQQGRKDTLKVSLKEQSVDLWRNVNEQIKMFRQSVFVSMTE